MKLVLASALLVLGTSALADTPADIYVQPCRVENDSDYLQASLLIDLLQDTWTWRETAFEAQGCTTRYLTYDRVYSPAIQNGNLNLTVRSASYTSLTDSVTDSLNQISWCGFVNWKTNTPKDVTGKTCEDYQVPNLGNTTYSIVKIDGSQIRVGQETQGHDGTSETQRYSQLNAQPFTRPSTLPFRLPFTLQ